MFLSNVCIPSGIFHHCGLHKEALFTTVDIDQAIDSFCTRNVIAAYLHCNFCSVHCFFVCFVCVMGHLEPQASDSSVFSQSVRMSLIILQVTNRLNMVPILRFKAFGVRACVRVSTCRYVVNAGNGLVYI